jgi:hypothetical protein
VPVRPPDRAVDTEMTDNEHYDTDEKMKRF